MPHPDNPPAGRLDIQTGLERKISGEKFGRTITFFLPGMFTMDGITGKYPAVSMTGGDCSLQCDHCRGKLLAAMIPARTPEELVDVCLALEKKGNQGVLISGGCDKKGRLPWNRFVPAITKIKQKTNLYISIHSGIIDASTAICLKKAGVDQALIDVVGSDETCEKIFHLRDGVSKIESSLKALQAAGLPTIPHIVCGLDQGRVVGEKKAVEMISRFDIKQLVFVSLMRIPGTPLGNTSGPSPEDVGRLISFARFRMPEAVISLGCARQRGNVLLEMMAIDAGVNRMALPSEEAIRHAEKSGLTVAYRRTCCSVP
jgi:lipoyl synthase